MLVRRLGLAIPVCLGVPSIAVAQAGAPPDSASTAPAVPSAALPGAVESPPAAPPAITSAALPGAVESPPAPPVALPADSVALPADAVPIEQLDLGALLGREVRGGQAGSFTVLLDEYNVPTSVHAYLSLEGSKKFGGDNPPPATFDLHHLVLMMHADLIDDHVIPEMAVEWEHAGTEMYIPFAFVDARADDWLVVRCGLFPAPVGSFNEYQYPDFTRKTVRPALAMREIVPSLWSEIGVQARGKFEWAKDRNFNYAVFVSNGLQQKAGEEVDAGGGAPIPGLKAPGKDGNNAKSVGGRLGLAPAEGLDLGVSGYSGVYSIKGSRRVSMTDADVSYRTGALTFRAEGVVALLETEKETLTLPGGYGLVAYRALPWFEPYVQLEGVKSGASDESQKLRGVAGIVFHPFEEQPGALRFDVKLEGSGARDGTDANTGELMSQVTAAF